MKTRYVLGIDTSNYKTSVAIIDSDYKIIYDARKFLSVKKGQKGLRQSDALFQHVQNLPQLIADIPVDLDDSLSAVAYSNRPRPIEGSYMPVFTAGASLSRSLASVNAIQAVGFSHQEGHIEAIMQDAGADSDTPFLACHFSGGTTEILKVVPRHRNVVLNTGIFYDIEPCGGTKDIALGQVIDRAGVTLGMEFPAGESLDGLACLSNERTDLLTPIKVRGAYFNLSGIDTQIKRIIEDEHTFPQVKENPACFACEIMTKLAAATENALFQASEMNQLKNIVMAGGVSSSRFIRHYMRNSEKLKNCNVLFGKPELSQDNAVGTAILGGRYIWD